MEQPTADRQPAAADAVMDNFKSKLKECTVYGACGRPYVRVAMLKDWLKSDAPLQNAASSCVPQAELLLEYAYKQRDFRPVEIDDICRGTWECLLVFSILLDLGCGELIDQCKSNRIVDGRLPIDLAALEQIFQGFQWIDAVSVDAKRGFAKQLADRFNDRQWAFCPATFDLRESQVYPRHHIIPVCEKTVLPRQGGTATLYLIHVQEEFVGRGLRELVVNSRYGKPEHDMGPRYHFALKTFKEGHRQVYENEKTAFQAFYENKGMIRYLCDFTHSEVHQGKTIATYNILLEFGDGDLDGYFQCFLPPVLQMEVCDFWKDLFEVADAVQRIHNFAKARGGGRQEYYGWHADIKPDNILSIQEKFKLADPGFARIEKKKTDRGQTIMSGGTTTYGAPEVYRARYTRDPVDQTIDIWSLGCVFSIVATWIVLGHQGIVQFNNMRVRAVEEIVRQRATSSSGQKSEKSEIALVRGDYFHDSQEVLKDVTDWHQVLRSAVRRTDTITGQVLDVVDEHMLRGAPKQRIDAKALCTKLRDIFVESQAKTPDLVPANIMQALLAMNEEAEPTPVNSTITPKPSRTLHAMAAMDRQSGKSKNLDVPPLLKTARRSEYLKSALSVPHVHASDVSDVSNVSIPVPVSVANAPPPPAAVVAEQTPRMDSSHQKEVSSLPLQQAFHRHQTSRGSIRVPLLAGQHKPQNVFQARARIERNLLRQVRKDSFLTRYFKNRDIQFLVDNADSMTDEWDEATFLLETLVLKAKGQDPNGMDLFFTGGPHEVRNTKEPAPFVKAMGHRNAVPMASIHPNINEPLGRLLRAYLADLRNLRRYGVTDVVKNLTLIVLTDGKWEGMGEHKNDVDRTIINFVEEFAEITGDKYLVRPVSIQFIQFGNDPDATIRLRRLDDELIFSGVPDIVDTEPSNGDVIKMLIGSFVEEYDERDQTLSPSDSNVSVTTSNTGNTTTPENSTSKTNNHAQPTYFPHQATNISPPALVTPDDPFASSSNTTSLARANSRNRTHPPAFGLARHFRKS